MLLDVCRSRAELATKGGPRASKAEEPFPSALGYGVMLPKTPSSPPCPCPGMRTFPRAQPLLLRVHPLGNATTFLCRALCKADITHSQAVTCWQSPQTVFPKKPHLFPKACRRESGRAPWLVAAANPC